MKSFIKTLLFSQLICLSAIGQTLQKNITHNTHTWVSINSSLFINRHFFVMTDLHLRENGFFASKSFLFGRVGLGYQFDKNLSVVLGYGNLLSAPTTPGWKTDADENRLFEQVQLTGSYKKIKILQRLRNEQRWQTVIVNDAKTGQNKFTDRKSVV